MQNPEGGDNSSPGPSFALNDVSNFIGKREVIFAFGDTEGGCPSLVNLSSQGAFNHKNRDITIHQRWFDEKCALLKVGCKQV